MSDVYARLAAMLGGGTGRQGAFTPGGWLFGDVLEAGRGELRLACGGLSLTQGDVKVDRGLSYTWTEDEGQEHYLRAGDRVLVLVTADGQEYYVLKKAVFV